MSDALVAVDVGVVDDEVLQALITSIPTTASETSENSRGCFRPRRI